MLRNLRSLIIIIILVTSGKYYSQITITSTDILAQYKVGTTHTLNSDTTTQKVNIGTTGQNTWDFSNLVPSMSYTLTSVNPAATPFASEFPNANLAYNYQLEYMGVSAESYVYSRLDNDFVSLGIASTGSPIPGTTVVSIIKEVPPAITMKLPATLGSSWQQAYAESMLVTVAGSPFQSSVSQVNSTSIIDAYGTAKIPGGKTINVLRIKRDDRTYTKNSSGQGDTYSRVISYMFYSKTGDYVSVVVGDTTQPDHGEVVAINVGWNQYAATAVNEKTATVTTFELEQNYPNPFNPSTSIKYSIAADSFVELKVFDSIGKEVKTLVSQNQGRGQYSVAFSADDLPSGVYVARLKAGSYTKSVKMLLMK